MTVKKALEGKMLWSLPHARCSARPQRVRGARGRQETVLKAVVCEVGRVQGQKCRVLEGRGGGTGSLPAVENGAWYQAEEGLLCGEEPVLRLE